MNESPTQILVRQVGIELEAKNQAYSERNRLVCFLACLYPSHMKLHPAEDTAWEKDWRTIICVHSPEDGRYDGLDDGDLCEAFRAIYDRYPDTQDRETGLWSLLCAAVDAEDDEVTK